MGRPNPLAAAVAATLFAAPPAHAANADYQAFFFTVCGTATGALAARCAETPAGLGNLSGNSESSLNPSQNLAHNLAPLGTAQARSKAARERGERLREDEPAPAAEAARIDAGPFSLLINLQGTWFERDARGDAVRGLDGDSTAAEIGLDWRLSDRVVLGALAGLERVDYDFDAEAPGVNFTPASRAGEADADNAYLTLFANFAVGDHGFIELSGGYERSDGDYVRNPVFQESTRAVPQRDARLEGSADGTTTWVGINGGWDFQRGATSIGPFAGVTWTRAELDPYTERDPLGSGLAMSFSGTDRDSLLAHAGLRISRAFSTGSGVLLPQLRLEYQRELENDRPAASSRLVLDGAGTRYELAGGKGDDDALNGGLSLVAVLPNGWTLFADWSILIDSSSFDRQRATLGLRKEL